MGLKKNSEVFAEVIVGAFMVAILGLLVYFTIIISGVEIFTGKNKVPVAVFFHDVGGLKLRDSVILRGMTVGSVDDLQLNDNGVRVTLLIEDGVRFREGYRVSVNTGSLLGGNYLLIEEGKGKELPRETVLQGETPNNWMRDLGEIVANLKTATEGDHIRSIITNLDASVEMIRGAVTRVQEGKGMLGKLFSDDLTLYNEMSNAVVRFRSMTSKFDTGTNSLGRLINDDGRVYDDLRDSIANIKSVTARLEKGDGTLGKLLSSDDTVYRDLQETVSRLKNVAVRLDSGEGSLAKLLQDDNKVYNDLDTTVANLKEVTGRLVKGEGTLGKLSANDELYNDVEGLVRDVRQTVDNFRDTTPISAFASLIMGGL